MLCSKNKSKISSYTIFLMQKTRGELAIRDCSSFYLLIFEDKKNLDSIFSIYGSVLKKSSRILPSVNQKLAKFHL